MSMLSKIKSGPQKRSYIYMCYGPNGVGKSTFAAAFPKPLFADLEKGSFHLDVDRNDEIDTLDKFKELVGEMLSSTYEYKTFVIDSVEALEVIIANSVKAKHSVATIEDIPYGKGAVEMREIMQDLMSSFRKLADEKNISVVLIGHSQIKSHSDPVTNVSWDRYIMRCSDKLAAIIKDQADHIFFITHKVFTLEDKNKKGKMQAFSEGQRVIKTQWRNAWDAKTRLDLPLEIPLSYAALDEALNQDPKLSSDSLIADIKEMAETLPQATKDASLAWIVKYPNNIQKLKELKNRIINVKEKS